MKITSPFCVALDGRMPMAWATVMSTMMPIAISFGSSPGTTREAKLPAANACTATGAEKPTISEPHPAR